VGRIHVGEPAILVRKLSPRSSMRTLHNSGIPAGFWRRWRLSELLKQASIHSEIPK
jgi:hypothetical protein